MIKELTYKITYYIKENSDIKNNRDLEKIDYSLQAIFNELFKTIVLALLFLILGKINYFLFSVTILFSIRIFAGGYHCNTTIKCLSYSILFFLVSCFIGGSITYKLNTSIYYIIGLLSIFIVALRSPYPNKKRPIKNKKRRYILKIAATFFTILWTYVLLFHIKNADYLNCGFITIVLQVLQLVQIGKE
ncbi:accessory gene regulator B family protein [Clostridium sp. MB40-C1]|uniref:accessory gene regulator ArgB-like protein n=1 Tax=Clostridium sp. MB40-C1 TaxID=3070996 RepID=UPI0027E1D3B0|nr:accessory gene regulator B family protein [Clostridium sp. MB40-C1]WMJ79419.1 accessory gene regulator B family protein [Clostridium sp. MB40-C1]